MILCSYSGDSVGENGGVLLSNYDEDANSAGSESIYLSRIEVGPPVTRY
jgi:hypothetical protein